MYNNIYGQFNPYQQNVAIVKSYFRKPIILVQGIMYILSILISTASVFVLLPALNKYIDAIFSIPQVMQDMTAQDMQFMETFTSVYTNVVPLVAMIPSVILLGLTAAAYIIIYNKSKNDDPSSSPKVGVTILFVLSIIQLVPIIISSIIMLVCIVALIVLSIAASVSQVADSSVALWPITIIYTVVFGGMFAVILTYFISQVRYYKSVKDSLTSVNLSYKGAGLYGVFTIIYGVYVIMNAVSGFFALPMLKSMMSLFPIEFAEFYQVFDNLSPVFIFSSVSYLITGAITIISAIIALGYKKHIRAYTDGYAQMPSQQYAPAYETNTYAVSAQTPQPQQDQQPQFESVVFNDSKPIPENTYCPRCFTPAKEGDVFCSACGTKL